jgi:hypothetical protein
MLSTKDMSAGSGKVKPIISVGNQVIKINKITLDQTPYDSDAYNVVLHVESKPIGGDFTGFLKDTSNPNGERYQGQVGRIRFTPYPYKDTTLPSGRDIQKDTEILKGMIFLSEVLEKRDELDMVEAATIEEFVEACDKLFSGSTYINACVGGREWQNQEGYINHDLFLPRLSKDGIPLEKLDAENSRLLTYNKEEHLKELKTKSTPTVDSFEPNSFSANDTFDLS